MGAGDDRAAARAPVILERNGLRIAFLDRVDAKLNSHEWPGLDWEATDHRSGLAYARPAQLRADVRAARRHADVVVVMLHSGREYAKGPTKAQRRVVKAADRRRRGPRRERASPCAPGRHPVGFDA